jgi:hypothetical protein
MGDIYVLALPGVVVGEVLFTWSSFWGGRAEDLVVW